MEEKRKVPTVLIVTAVLSFLFMAVELIVSIFSLIQGPLSKQEIKEEKASILEAASEFKKLGADTMVSEYRKLANMVESVSEIHATYTLFSTMVVLIGIIAVIFMLLRKRLGFHGYIIYSILAALQFYIFFPVEEIPTVSVTVSIVISIVFVLLYARNLKWMNK